MDIFIESPRGVLVRILRNTLRFIAPRACDRYMREGTIRRRDTRFARVRAYAKDKTDTFFLREIASKPLAWGNVIEYHDRKREGGSQKTVYVSEHAEAENEFSHIVVVLATMSRHPRKNLT